MTLNFTTETIDQRREILTDALMSGSYEVTFIKVDGSLRVMPCTLSPDLIPESLTESVATDRKKNDSVIKVYSLEQQAWRSFRIENVQSIKKLA